MLTKLAVGIALALPPMTLLLAAHGCAGRVNGDTSDAGVVDGVAACSTPRACPSHVGPQIYCCVDHACGADAPDACPDGSQQPILAANYDQSCQTDTDCVLIGEGNACSMVNPCPNAAISKAAYAKYQSDIAAAPCFALAGCPASLPPCCRQGVCRTNDCSSPADTLPACADAGGICSPFTTECGTKGAGPPGSCAFPDEMCCLR